jgi:hypothetical protein
MRRFNLTLTAAVLLTASPAAYADALYLSVPVRIQERGGWCWAASDQMINGYYGKFFDEQCEILENYHFRRPDWGTTNCCLSPDLGCNSSGGAGGDETTSMGIGTTLVGRALSFQEIRTEITAGHPFFVYVPGHWLVGRGYVEDGGTQSVVINEPWPYGESSWGNGANVVSYSELLNLPWEDTVKTTSPGSSYATLYSDNNLAGRSLTVTTGSTSFGFVGFPPFSFDNQASSARVVGSPYILYDGQNYDGSAWGVNAKAAYSGPLTRICGLRSGSSPELVG